jgi:hypothetical protein
MSQNNTSTKKSALKGKKRYIAIAALAALVATGGVVGATVTAESTIANNQITINEPNVNVTVTGDPIKVEFDSGSHPVDEKTPMIGVTKFTATNTGTSAAKITAAKVEGLQLANRPGVTEDHKATLIVSVDGYGSILVQSIGTEPTGESQRAYTLKAGQTVELTAYLNSGINTSDWNTFDMFDLTFDLQFDYVPAN